MRHNIALGGIIALVTLILDQWSKIAAFAFLQEQGMRSYPVTPFFNLVEVYNSGVSFGLLSGLTYGPAILSVFTILIVVALCIWLIMADSIWLIIGLGLVVGGAIGNIIDRLSYGAVKDFLDFYVNTFHWPAFNVADSAVCIGVLIVVLDGMLDKTPKKEEKE